jgi:hypothetical protein
VRDEQHHLTLCFAADRGLEFGQRSGVHGVFRLAQRHGGAVQQCGDHLVHFGVEFIGRMHGGDKTPLEGIVGADPFAHQGHPHGADTADRRGDQR